MRAAGRAFDKFGRGIQGKLQEATSACPCTAMKALKRGVAVIAGCKFEPLLLFSCCSFYCSDFVVTFPFVLFTFR